jgi:hypothetical protein
MNNENDNGLDDLFKKKLEDPVGQIGYDEEDWDALEQMLDKRTKRKGLIFWLPIISSAAAVLLLVLGWWNFRTKTDQQHQQIRLQAVNHHQKSNTDTIGGLGRQALTQNPAQTPTQKNPANYAVTPNVNKGSKISNSLLVAGGASHATTSVTETGQKDTTINRADEPLLAANFTTVFTPEQITAQQVSPVDLQKKYPAVLNAVTHITKNPAAFRPVYALSVLAAPDVNGVGSFQQGKVGTNAGLLFTAGVSKKFTISTGVLYSDKPYLTPFENYHTSYQFQQNPINVSATCRMLDIPLNIGYQIYNKHQNKLSIGTGLSSYIMLQQDFKFNYADPYAKGPSDFNVPNSSGYFFGILNLNATYERQINSKVGITLQPYLKLPLTNIGYSEVRLQTTGVAVGLSWNLNSLSKH